MMEYAVVLLCVVVLAYWFYGSKKGNINDKYNAWRLVTVMPKYFNKVTELITRATAR